MTTEELLKRCRDAGIIIPPSGMVRAATAKQILGVTMRTLEEWRRADKPPKAVRLNGSWYYDVAEIARAFE